MGDDSLVKFLLAPLELGSEPGDSRLNNTLRPRDLLRPPLFSFTGEDDSGGGEEGGNVLRDPEGSNMYEYGYGW